MIQGNYECVLITNSLLSDDGLEKIVVKYKELIEKNGGVTEYSENWGRRKLAYPIKQSNHGYYHLYYFSGTGDTVEELQKQTSYDEQILRCFVSTVKNMQQSHEQFLEFKNEPERNANKYLETIEAGV